MNGGATGWISCERTADGLVWDWIGGDTAWITAELLAMVDDGVLSTRMPAHGETFIFGPFTLRRGEYLIKERVYEVIRVEP